MKRYRIRIAAGEYKGRYVGQPLGGGLVTDPEVQQKPPVNVPGYALWAQEGGGTQFFEGKTSRAEAELNALGYSTELVEVR